MDLRLLKEIGALRVFNKGDTIFRFTEEGRNLYILLKGNVFMEGQSFESIRNSRVDISREGSLFGEMALLDGHKRFHTVRAGKDKTIVLEISTEDSRKLLQRDSDFAFLLLRTLVIHIQYYMDALMVKDPAFVYQFRYGDTFRNVENMDKPTFIHIVRSNPEYPMAIVNSLVEMVEIFAGKNMEIKRLEADK